MPQDADPSTVLVNDLGAFLFFQHGDYLGEIWPFQQDENSAESDPPEADRWRLLDAVLSAIWVQQQWLHVTAHESSESGGLLPPIYDKKAR